MPKKSAAKKNIEPPFNSVNRWLDKLNRLKDFKSSKKFWFVILIIGLLVLAFYKRSWFVAAMVDGTPITNLELQMRLNDQYRTQTLNQMINEKILMNEAQKNNDVPTEAEINNKVSELETQVGGQNALNSLLAQQGQTLQSLRDQVKLQLIITKLYQNEATVSADEVDQYIKQNGTTLQATDSAGQKQEAYNLLQQQKLTQIFNQKFQDLRSKASVQIF